MAIEVTVVRDLAALRALESEWRALAGGGPSILFRGPDWLLPWWLAYHNTLHGELHVLVGRATEPDGTARRPAISSVSRRSTPHRQGRAARYAASSA